MSNIYKSAEILLGDKKELQFDNIDIIEKEQSYKKDEEEESTDAIAILESSKNQSREILIDAENKRKEIIDNAEKEALEIVKNAEINKGEIYKQAKDRGYNEGFEAGEQKGYEELRGKLREVAAIKKNTLEEKKETAWRLEKEIIDLVITIVKKIISHKIETDDQLLLNLIKKGLEKCTFTESLIIRVNKEDYTRVSDHKDSIYMMTEGIDDIEIKSDAALPRGSMIIETLSGQVDASIDVQISQIKSLFEELLKSGEFYGYIDA